MKLLLASIIMICASPLICDAQTYRWTDNHGVIHFTDTLESVPPKYRKKVKISPDITVRDPKIQDEIKQQEQRALQEQAAKPRTAPAPSPSAPVAAPQSPPSTPPPADVKNEEPPPRTRSQKIRDNIERRKQEEEKAQQSGQTQP